MDLFGIGIPEILLFLVIMLVILGPSDIVTLAGKLGKGLRKLWTSPTWRMIFTASDTLRKLPNTLAREAGVDELRRELRREADVIQKMGKEINQSMQVDTPIKTASPPPLPGDLTFSAWTTPPEGTASTGGTTPPEESPSPSPTVSSPDLAHNTILPPEALSKLENPTPEGNPSEPQP